MRLGIRGRRDEPNVVQLQVVVEEGRINRLAGQEPSDSLNQPRIRRGRGRFHLPPVLLCGSGEDAVEGLVVSCRHVLDETELLEADLLGLLQ